MIVRTFICIILFSLMSVSQDVNVVVSNENIKIVNLSIQNLDKNESCRFLDKSLIGIDGVFFCSFSSDKMQSFIVIENDFDMNILADKLNAYGFGLMENVEMDFDEKEYLLHYLNYQNIGLAKTTSDMPEFINTGNYERDLAAYNKAKEIYLLLNNEN